MWTVGALLGGPLRLGRAHTRSGTTQSRAVVQSLVLGLLLLGVFLAGAVVAGGIPVLREPVERLLDHARLGWLPLVALGILQYLTPVIQFTLGVTVFGLIFTPVFYVMVRWLADLRGTKRKAAAAQPTGAH